MIVWRNYFNLLYKIVNIIDGVLTKDALGRRNNSRANNMPAQTKLSPRYSTKDICSLSTMAPNKRETGGTKAVKMALLLEPNKLMALE